MSVVVETDILLDPDPLPFVYFSPGDGAHSTPSPAPAMIDGAAPAAVKKKDVPEWLNSPLWYPAPSAQPEDPAAAYAPLFPPVAAAEIAAAPASPAPRASPPPSTSHDPDSECTDHDDAAFPGRVSSEESVCRSQILLEIGKRSISVDEVRRLACQGIPDGAAIRPTVWKLLLGYLPNCRSLWPQELEKKRSQYMDLKYELLINPSEKTRKLDDPFAYRDESSKFNGRRILPRHGITHGEHPLSLEKTSAWNQFFQDKEMKEQIELDIRRTHPDMPFFSGDSSFSKYNQGCLMDILLIFAKLNPGIRYVQGMNEILAPLFYVFRNDPDEKNSASAEADTFFCFIELLSGFQNVFCPHLDNTRVGIRSTIDKFSQLLKKHDEELWRHLEVTTKVYPHLYAFRWITLLLTREFSFKDIFYIWDAILCDPEGPQEALLRICCIMLILVRRNLLGGDFTSILKLLQNYPPKNISHLLHLADKLRGLSVH